jgi:hypothetical protein
MTDVVHTTVGPIRIQSYSAFWPYYLREHTKPSTRAIHYLGTAFATGCLLMLAVTGSLWFLLAALAGSFGPAWAAHVLVENNRPVTFTYPFWSLYSDYRMAWFWATGRLERELLKACARRPAITAR